MLEIPSQVLTDINQHGEKAYPEEGAGLLLGYIEADERIVERIFPLTNSREDAARHNRYLITAQDMLKAEDEALRLGLDVIGVFHSHPDHPDEPSEFDREWALPWFSYLITSVRSGRSVSRRSWRLSDDRSLFWEENILTPDSA
jgi:proteasome lid subunit RPN8/RPN11